MVFDPFYGVYGAWGWGHFPKRRYGHKSTTYYTWKVEEELIPDDTFMDQLAKNIMSCLTENTIFIEPHVGVKFMQMVCMMPRLEVYADLVIEKETLFGVDYICVKDAVIPYQRVTSGHFESSTAHLAKWMNELNRNPDGSLKPVEEVNKITSKMLGRFHSHDSVGGCGPSITDDDDVAEFREGMPFWIEIIGTKKNLQGRIALESPIRTMTKVDVKVKWWSGWEDTFKQMSGYVFKEKWSSTYKDGWKREDKKEGTKSASRVVGVIEFDEDASTNTGIMLPERCRARTNRQREFEIIKWDRNDPVQVGDIITKDNAEKIARMFESTLRKGEEIKVWVFDDDQIVWALYDKDGEVIGELLDTIYKRNAKVYDLYMTVTKELGVSEDFSAEYVKGFPVALERTYDWMSVVDKLYERWSAEAEVEELSGEEEVAVKIVREQDLDDTVTIQQALGLNTDFAKGFGGGDLTDEEDEEIRAAIRDMLGEWSRMEEE